MSEQTVLWAIGGLIAALAALIQWWMKRIERDIGSYRTEAKLQIDGIGGRLTGHQLDVAQNYVSFSRLSEAMRHVDDRLRGLAEGQEKIFAKLDSKADKPGHRG